MLIHDVAALAAAACWAVGGLISVAPAKHLGAIGYNRARMVVVFLMLASYVTIDNSWSTIQPQHWQPMLWSGFIGIFIGDTVLFLTLNRLGPRRTAILFAMNAPIATLLGWLFLDEVISLGNLTGIAMVTCGVVLAIAYGHRASHRHQWEKVNGSLSIGVGLGLLTALAQAVGTLIMRPVMQTGVDPVAASALRIGVAALALSLLMQLPVQNFKQQRPFTPAIVRAVVLAGFFGMGLGMTLFIFALSGGKVGIVSTLSSTSPMLVLPLIWLRTGEAPAPGAWLGALLVSVGTTFIFLD